MTPSFKTAVFYEVPAYAFQDSSGDGTGLTERLDYRRWLGVTCMWTLPFYESPPRDDGYDMSVIADLVVNHTSGQHGWGAITGIRRQFAPGRLAVSPHGYSSLVTR